MLWFVYSLYNQNIMIEVFKFFYFMKNKTIRSLILVGDKKNKIRLVHLPWCRKWELHENGLAADNVELWKTGMILALTFHYCMADVQYVYSKSQASHFKYIFDWISSFFLVLWSLNYSSCFVCCVFPNQLISWLGA